jgi:regulator of protease activity HflC (stomatin/prohibitin superfamily)
MENQNKVDEAIVENQVARIEAETAVVEAQASAIVAEAKAAEAIAEARADSAEEIVDAQLPDENEEEDIDEQWLTEKFLEVSNGVSKLELQLAEKFQSLETNQLKLLTLVEAVSLTLSQIAEKMSQATVVELNQTPLGENLTPVNPVNVEADPLEVKTESGKKRRKI